MARGASYERLADGLDEHENEQRYRDEDEDDDSTLVPKKSVKAKAALKGLVGPYGKPTTYYGEGSFDAPSSDEEEKDEDGEGETGRLINKPPGSPGLAERGGAGEPKVRQPPLVLCLCNKIVNKESWLFLFFFAFSRNPGRSDIWSYSSQLSLESLPSLA